MTFENNPSNKSLELVEQAKSSVPVAVDTSPQAMLMTAVQRGATLEELEKLIGLKERMDAEQARRAYTEDMALFKRTAPTIIKDKLVAFTTRDGDTTSYTHATIGNVVKTITPKLAECGFSHDWKVTRLGDGQHSVTCTVTHRMGHSEAVTLAAHSDTSGKKNAIQQMASTVTYLQRYTLLAALGLATEDQEDDDGRKAGCVNDIDTLEDEEQALIGQMRKLTKDGDTLKFWNEHKEKFRSARGLYDHFKQACAAHREFIQQADK